MAEKYGVTLCVKAHVGESVYNTPTTLQVMEAITSPAFGIDMDPSHIYRAGENPVEAIAAVISRVKHVHIRDCKGRQQGPGKPETRPTAAATSTWSATSACCTRTATPARSTWRSSAPRTTASSSAASSPPNRAGTCRPACRPAARGSGVRAHAANTHPGDVRRTPAFDRPRDMGPPAAPLFKAQPALLEAHIVVVPDYDMVEQGDAEQLAGFHVDLREEPLLHAK